MKEKKELLQYGAILVVILFLFFHYWDIAISWLFTFLAVIHPLLMGCVTAYVLNLIMSFYERTIFSKWKGHASIKRALSILLSLVTLLIIVIMIINMILPELKSCIDILISSIPKVWQQILAFIDNNPDVLTLLPNLSNIQIDAQKILDQIISWIRSGVGASVFGYITSILSVVFNLFVTLIFAIYLLAGKEWLGRQFNRLVDTYLHKPVLKEKGLYILQTLDNSFHRFIVGQCTEAVILGSLCIIGMFILQLPYAVMIGILIGATALIPIFGAYIGGAVGFIMVFTVSPLKSIIFVVFLSVLQQFENQLIYPRVVGTSIGLPGILVFAAVTIGGSMFGIAGVLLGIPITAACYQLLKNDLRKRELQK